MLSLEFIFLLLLNRAMVLSLPSCIYPPCIYNVFRNPSDMGNIIVKDKSNHSINWTWDVRGGHWDVTYKYSYPSGWYEGCAKFIKCSPKNNDEYAFVSWGYGKNWESNAVPIHANAWNLSYNGDLFGFVPTGSGRYLFRIFSKNRRHNPFGDDSTKPSVSCFLTSSDKVEIIKWWVQRKTNKDCQAPAFNWSWNSNNGKWRVHYKLIMKSDETICSVFYKFYTYGPEYKVITWQLNIPKKSVSYTANPIRINGESLWRIKLSGLEFWGFTPRGTNEWIFQHFSMPMETNR